MGRQGRIVQMPTGRWRSSGWLVAGLSMVLALLAACGTTSDTSTGATQLPVSGVVISANAHYGVHDALDIDVNNRLPGDIQVADHQTDCSIVQLERQDGQTWTLVNPCQLKSPTRLITLATQSTSRHTVHAPSTTGWSSGTYRATITYTSGNANQSVNVHSSTFTIA